MQNVVIFFDTLYNNAKQPWRLVALHHFYMEGRRYHDFCIRYNQSHILRCFNCHQDTSCFAQAR